MKGGGGKQGLGPEERLRLDAVVLTAASLETAERTAYLRQLTSDHPELLRQTQRLLVAASEVSESFLNIPALEILGEVEPASVPGESTEPDAPPTLAEERYALGTLLGSGGMAEVYRAHDRQLDRPVALKLSNHRDGATLRECLKEARAQARVRHENVLEVYETGEFQGRPFIALRFVAGTTLAQVRDSTSGWAIRSESWAPTKMHIVPSPHISSLRSSWWRGKKKTSSGGWS